MIYTIGAQVSSYITIGLLGAAILGALIGFVHGLRKSTYRWITFMIFVVIAVIISQTAIDFLVNFPIGDYLKSIPNLPAYVSGETLAEIAVSVANNFVTDTSENAAKIVLALASIFVRIVYFIIMFTVVKFVYNFLTQIIWMIFLKGKKYKSNGKRKSKKRLLGAGLTAIKGALIYCVMCIVLLNGPISLVPELIAPDTQTQKLSTSEEELDELLIIIQDVVDNYKQTFMYTAFAGDGTNPSINDTLNNFFWTSSYEGYEVNLYEELSTLVDLGLNAYDVYNAYLNDNVIDYENVSVVVKSLAESDLIVDILPIALEAATKMEVITSQLPDSVELVGLEDINWKQDLEKLGDLVMDLKLVIESVDFSGLYEESETGELLDKIDITGVSSEDVEKVFATLASISFVTKAMNIAVSYALTLESVTSTLGTMELEMESLVWEEELTDIGAMVGRFLDLGIRSKDAVVENLNDTINGLDFGKFDEEGYGQVGDLITAIFASSFVNQVFPKVMENVVYPMIPAEYQSIFNFDCIATKGWLSELEALLDIFKTARGNNEEPELFIKDDGKFNTKLLKNLTPDTILGSELLSTSLQQGLIMVKDGTLSFGEGTTDMIIIPDKYADKDNNSWKETTINKYIAQEKVTIGDTVYEKYNTISISEYEALDSQLKSKFTPSMKIVGGELYNLVNAFTTLLNVVEIEELNENTLTGLLCVENIEKLLQSHSKNIERTNISVIMDSEILSYTLTSVMMESTDGMIVIPKDDSILLSAEVDSKTGYALKSSEVEALLHAIVELEIMKTVYVCVEPITDGSNTYNEGDIVSKEIYDSLSIDKQAKIAKQTEFNLSFDLLNTLLEQENGEEYTKLDYILGSDDGEIEGSKVLAATISKYIVDSEATSNLIVVPDTVVSETIDITNESIQVIDKQELKALVQAIVKLEIINVQYVCVEAGQYNGQDYQVDDTISQEVYDTLTDAEKAKFTSVGVITADLSLLDNLLDEVDDDDGYTRLDYALGSDDGEINGSKILHATLSKILLDLKGSEQGIVIPDEVIISEGNCQVIEKDEIKALVTAAIKLELIENGQIKLSFDVVNTLLETPENDTNTKLDYIVGTNDIKGSKIILATLSDMIIKQGEAGTIIVPNTVIVKEGNCDVIATDELESMVVALIKLDIIDDAGNIGADLTLMNSLLDVDTTGTTKLDYAVDSKILHATLSDKIIEQGEAGTIIVPNTVIVKEGNCYVIATDELESMVVALIKLDIIDDAGNIGADLTLMNSLLDVDATGTTKLDYAVDSKILHATLSDKIIEQEGTIIIPENVIAAEGDCVVVEQSELESLVTALIKLEIIDSSGNVSADIKLVNTLLEKPQGDSNTRLDYVVGNASVKGSKIMNATISDKILQQAETDTIVIPEDAVEYFGTKPVIKSTSLYNLVNSLIKLEIIDDSGNLNADLSMISKMLYVDNSGTRRLDYVIESDIMALTISKYIVEQSNVISESNALVIPNTMYESVDKYGSTQKAYSINPVELRNLLSTIVKLEIVDDEGNLNAGLGVVSTLNSKYTYKAEETINGVNVVDDYEVIYSIIGNNSLDGSIIMRATISKFIYEQKATLKIFNYVSETHGDVDVLKASEMEHLIDAINSMNIIIGDSITDISVITDSILHNKTWQEKIDNSIILRATVSSEVIYALYGDDISTVGDAINYICIETGIYNGIRYEVDQLISYDEYKVLTSNKRSKFVKFEEYICIEEFDDYEIGDAITIRTYNTLSQAQQAKFILTEVISEEEMMKLFNALALLHITNFENTTISLSTIFSLTDSELNTILNSVLIWDAASRSIQESTTMSDEESVGILHDMTIEEGISHRGSNWICQVGGVYDGIDYQVGQVITPQEYVSLKTNDSSVEGKFKQEIEFAFSQQLYLNLGIERYERIELIHTFNTFEEIVNTDANDNTDFSIKVEDLEIIYQEPEKFAKLMTDSILLTYSIKEIVIYSIEHAFKDSNVFTGTQKEEMIARIDVINQDMARWKEYENSIYPDGNDNASPEYDGQLVKMLKALNSVNQMKNLNSITSKDVMLEHLYTIDNSEVMRFTLETLLATVGYNEEAPASTRKTCIDMYVNVLFGMLG